MDATRDLASEFDGTDKSMIIKEFNDKQITGSDHTPT